MLCWVEWPGLVYSLHASDRGFGSVICRNERTLLLLRSQGQELLHICPLVVCADCVSVQRARWVHADKEEKMWLSKTQFGDLWRYLMSINAIFIPAVMNAGILGKYPICCWCHVPVMLRYPQQTPTRVP